ncbi:MAG: acyl carrier protein [Deltaproteobacteria bacterium]|nr:acyl carrier protein [Deltaproteobacteria bacterium]
MISNELAAVILKELGLDAYELRDEMLASEVPGWDSLSHVSILSAVEARFGVRFKTLEVVRLKNVGELQQLLDRKLSEGR